MIYESSRSITSSETPEWARRLARDEPAWKLSWRNEPLLTRAEARAAIELTEICSGVGELDDRAEALAAQLGTTVREVQAILQQRRRERGESRRCSMRWNGTRWWWKWRRPWNFGLMRFFGQFSRNS
ncbi:hypothetical protein JMUB6875_70220 [Nocardia sp. JMUB6875]|uniref:hypothetical protein n=1 Tax=Nocardia sp. JMUB6875 TaxID=3158170 RepID=UPI0032E5AEC6